MSAIAGYITDEMIENDVPVEFENKGLKLKGAEVSEKEVAEKTTYCRR